MTIQIEEGKFYINRKDAIEGPMRQRPNQVNGFCWADSRGRTWRDDGHFLNSHDHPLDLIAQAVVETPAWAAAVEAEAAAAVDIEDDGFVTVVPDIKATIADEAKRIVSGARRSAYGKPEQNFERIARLWQAHFANTGRAAANVTANDISLLMVLMKIGRLAESPQHYDSWVDLVGYSLTGAEVNDVTKPA